ncbi:hypothetical protein [Compostibacter hankyongensis]|uniref:Lipoprotein n=1 Tax=Compostibacter hankyongensis TaxID=1007089 RepID=A0ABP8FSG1_9BACT
MKRCIPGLAVIILITPLFSSCSKSLQDEAGLPGTAGSKQQTEKALLSVPHSLVYIGGARSYAGIVGGDSLQSQYIRAHADGWYINNFAMDKYSGDSAYCGEAYKRFYSRNVFYETDFTYATDHEDSVYIDRFIASGFKVTYATVNRDYSPARKYTLKYQDSNRPVLRMVAPWKVYGDFNDSRNADLQNDIKNCQGSATDGPMTLWSANTGYMRIRPGALAGGSATLVQWTRSVNAHFTTMVMMAPNESTGKQFLNRVKDCVRMHERFNASPTIYVLSFYGPATFTCPVLPETSAPNVPDTTFAGAAYWLMRHVNGDPGFE